MTPMWKPRKKALLAFLWQQSLAPSLLTSSHCVSKILSIMCPSCNELQIVRHVPSWMPGAGFHKIARESRILADFVRDAPFAEVKDAMVS